MGRGKGGSTSHGKRTPGGIRTSSQMSKVGEIEAKNGVLGEEQAAGAPGRVDASKVDWEAKREQFKEKVIAYDKDRRKQMAELYNKYIKEVKAGNNIEEPDPEVLKNDLDRWDLQSKRKNKDIRSLDKYNHVTLHDAMKDYRTADEEIKEQKEKALKGIDLVSKSGDYKVMDVKSPEALMTLANDTHWCTQDKDRSERYLKSWDYRIVTKDGIPIAALKKFKTKEGLDPFGDPEPVDSILSRGDDELIDGRLRQYWSGNKKITLIKKDYDIINKAAKKFGINGIDGQVQTVKDNKELVEAFDESVKKMASMGSREARDNYMAVVSVLNGRLPVESEMKLANSTAEPDMIAQYAKSVGRVEAIEKVCEDYPELAIDYSAALGKRYPGSNRDKVEQGIVNDGAYTAVDYAEALQGRFKAGESVIATEPTLVVRYADRYGQNGFPGKYKGLAEQTLLASDDKKLKEKYARLLGMKYDEKTNSFVK